MAMDAKIFLLGVFGYNENAIQFYEQNGYHMRNYRYD